MPGIVPVRFMKVISISRYVRIEISLSRHKKSNFYRMAVNTCLSFLNEVKNLAKDTGIKYSDLCTQACPYRLARLGTSLRVRGKQRLRKKEIWFYYLNTLLTISYAGFLPLPLAGYGVSLHFRVATLLKIQFACHRS